MTTTNDQTRSFLTRTWDWATARSSKLSRRTLAWGGIVLAGIVFLSVNLISSVVLRNWQGDLTQDRLFTISDGTREILHSIDEPITARLYFSKKLGETAPSYASYFGRVRALLEQYRDISGGKLQLSILDPEPFSQAEDRAVAAGLSGMRLNPEGELGYFGLVATNATDNQETIQFFSPDRESFLEYDVTKLIHTLSNPKKHVVGLMTSLPLDGGTMPMNQQRTPPWLIMNQIREFFDVRTLAESTTSIPSDIDVLMVAQPRNLTPEAAYAIDQYALKGGKVIVFADPVPEAARLAMMGKTGNGMEELNKLLKSWGVAFDPKKVATDIEHARRVQFGRQQGGMVTEYVAWLGLDKNSIDQHDVLSAGIDTLNLASPGFLAKADGATTTFTPILKTGNQAMEVAVKDIGFGADPVTLLRNYKPGGKELVLAARISGEAKSAFTGKPKADDAAKKEGEEKKEGDDKNAAASTPATDGDKADATKPAESATTKAPEKADGTDKSHVASGKINIIVVADTDLLADQFWVQQRELMGQQVIMPTSHNASLVLGALENLSGSDALIALRGRGVRERPFTWVESLRREAERQYREKEQALTDKLKGLQQQLAGLESKGQGGAVILTDDERQTIENARAEMLNTRRQLRDVKLELRRGIDRLDGWLKFANIALVPLLIGVGGLVWSLWRGRRSKRSA
jgi:ABC-type uncharacterized transport system involved in gliding motility auxiliary subunit